MDILGEVCSVLFGLFGLGAAAYFSLGHRDTALWVTYLAIVAGITSAFAFRQDKLWKADGEAAAGQSLSEASPTNENTGTGASPSDNPQTRANQLATIQQLSELRSTFLVGTRSTKYGRQIRWPKDAPQFDVVIPSSHAINSAIELSKIEPELTVKALGSLLGDDDGRVSGGALFALVDIFKGLPASEVSRLSVLLRDSLPFGTDNDHCLNLNRVLISKKMLDVLPAFIFQHAKITDCVFRDVLLQKSTLSGAVLKNCLFVNVKFQETNISMTQWRNCQFFSCDFSNCPTELALFHRCDFMRNMYSTMPALDDYSFDPLFNKTTLGVITCYQCSFTNFDFPVRNLKHSRFHQCAFISRGNSLLPEWIDFFTSTGRYESSPGILVSRPSQNPEDFNILTVLDPTEWWQAASSNKLAEYFNAMELPDAPPSKQPIK